MRSMAKPGMTAFQLLTSWLGDPSLTVNPTLSTATSQDGLRVWLGTSEFHGMAVKTHATSLVVSATPLFWLV